MDDLDKRIAEANEEFISEEEEVLSAPVDIYQEQQNLQYEESKKNYPRGSREKVIATVKDVVRGAGTRSLAQAYERAKDDSESLKEVKEYRRAQMVMNQYMQESFLPAVEVVVNFTSPDELLNCKAGLDELDKYALGLGSMKGYTASYIREAYGKSLGQMNAASSPMVMDSVARIKGFLDTDQIVLAKGLAKKIKKKIDEGKTIAAPQEYQFILKIASSRNV